MKGEKGLTKGLKIENGESTFICGVSEMWIYMSVMTLWVYNTHTHTHTLYIHTIYNPTLTYKPT